MGSRAGLDGRKISSLPGLDPRTVHPVVSLAILTELPGPSEVPRGFQEVKVPRLRDNVPGWW